MRKAAANGLILPDDLVWREHGSTRIPARRVVGLFPTEAAGVAVYVPAAAKPPAAPAAARAPRRPQLRRLLAVAVAAEVALAASVGTYVVARSRVPTASASVSTAHVDETSSETASVKPPVAPSQTAAVSQEQKVAPPEAKRTPPKIATYGPHYLSDIRNFGVYCVLENNTSDPALSRRFDELGAGMSSARDAVVRMLESAGIRVFTEEKTWVSESRRLKRPILSLRIAPSMALLEGETGCYSIVAEAGQPARIHPGKKFTPVALIWSWQPSSGIATLGCFGKVFHSGLENLMEHVIADIMHSPDPPPLDEESHGLFSELAGSQTEWINPRSYLRDVAREGVSVRTVELMTGPDDERKLVSLGFDAELLRGTIERALQRAGYAIQRAAKPSASDQLDARHELVPSLQIHFHRLGLTNYVVLSARLALVEPIRILQSPAEKLRGAIPIPGFAGVSTTIATEDQLVPAVNRAFPWLIDEAGAILRNGPAGKQPVAAINDASQPERFDVWMDEDDFFPRRRYVATRIAGQIEGEARCYAENGSLCAIEHLVHGVLEGLRTSYYPSGRKFMEMPFRNGEPDGNAICWFEDGTIAVSREYRTGVPHGRSAIYFQNGRPMVEADMVAGVFQGMRRHYFHNGELHALSEWKEGVEINRRELRQATWSDIQWIERAQLSTRLKDHWKGQALKATPAALKPGMEPVEQRQKKTARKSRRDPRGDAMRVLFGG
jgi:hypothetical protein